MNVLARMKCNSITRTGDPKHPQMSIQLGAVYSSDPESPNRSFAAATPSGSLTLSIDAGRPAASAFDLGGEYEIEIRALGVPERMYLCDGSPPYNATEPYGAFVCSRDGKLELSATYLQGKWTVANLEAEPVTEGHPFKKLMDAGFTHWRHPRDGE